MFHAEASSPNSIPLYAPPFDYILIYKRSKIAIIALAVRLLARLWMTPLSEPMFQKICGPPVSAHLVLVWLGDSDPNARVVAAFDSRSERCGRSNRETLPAK